MFSQEAPKYFKKSINVVPIKPGTKYCEINDWKSINFEEVVDKYPKHGLGLDLSSVDVVVIDIDTLDKEAQKEISEFLKDYPTPVMRQGNPNKLPSRFYQKSWQTQKIPGDVVELLSADKGQMIQVVIPPTTHPDFKDVRFSWVDKSLTDFDVSNLPVFPEDAWNKLKAICSKYSKKKDSGEDVGLTESDGTRCMHNSHMKINSMVNAGLRSGDSVETVVKSILDFDEKYNDKVSYFLCPSRKEWRVKDRVANAYQVVIKAAQDLLKKGEIHGVENNVTSNISIEEKSPQVVTAKKYMKIPKIRNFGDIIFKQLYDNSPIKRSQMCHMNTMMLGSILIGNKVSYDGIGANVNLCGAAPSGYGKDFPFKKAKQILDEAGVGHLIGTNSPTSETIVLKLLEKSREQVFFINEAEVLLKKLTSERSNLGLQECLTDLFDYPGKKYTPKFIVNNNGKSTVAESVGSVYSPFLNLNMTLTIESFKNYFGGGLFEAGFGARFRFYFEDRYKRAVRQKDFNKNSNEKFIKLIQMFNRFNPTGVDLTKSSEKIDIVRLKEEPGVDSVVDEIFNSIEDEKASLVDHKFFSIFQRKYVYIVKFAVIDHCFKYPTDYEHQPIGKDSFLWAKATIDAIDNNMMIHLSDSVNKSKYGQKVSDYLKYITGRTEKGKSTSLMDLGKRFGEDDKAQRRKIIEDLIERGVVRSEGRVFYSI